jgi:uncharacterized protein (DUF305 family)
MVLAAALVATLLLAGCGGQESPAPDDAQKGFLQGMVPHHRSAVDMAKVAETEAESDFVKGLAKDIVSSQTGEIAQMGRIHQRMFRSPLQPDMGGHMALGLSAGEAGMDHMDGAKMIRGKKPFDRAFVDEMTPHHRGAIRMAEEVMGKTQDEEVRRLAESIVAAQRREIEEMNDFREREYGGPVPTAAGAGHTG